MRFSDAKSLVGKIVVLDMINNIRFTTKITGVSTEDGISYIETAQLLVFVLEVIGQNPQNGSLEVRLSNVLPYGPPEMAPQKKNYIDLTHVIMAGPAPDGIAAQYAKMTSSIIAAPANALPTPDLSKIAAGLDAIIGAKK